MMEDPVDVERARTFWSSVDVEQVFDELDECLCHLRYSISHHTATDTEYLRALAAITLLGIEATSRTEPAQNNSTIYPVVISTVGASQADEGPPSSSPLSPPGLLTNGLTEPRSPTTVHHKDEEEEEEATTPLSLPLPPYQPHDCSPACMSRCGSVSLWGEDPLRLPESCGFERLVVGSPRPAAAGEGAASSAQEGEELRDDDALDDGEEGEDQPEAAAGVAGGVVYRAPCGASLHSYEDVMRFLLVTDSFHLLQVDFFSFNRAVGLDPPRLATVVARPPEKDLSQGLEPTAVELCPAADGSRPADFRYRKDRWPHGCFLGRGPRLYRACCDCADGGCADAEGCACAALTAAGGRRYAHNRLTEPAPEGVYECGPWCGCVRSRCQNRLVQRGLTVRLQVFQTAQRRGWGVRCKDHLDAGTFICTYAGLALIRGGGDPDKAPPLKQARRAELPWDDEVEVVTEWLAPARPTSPPLHVPSVIQRPSETQQPQTHCTAADQSGEETAVSTEPPRPIRAEDMYFLDATKEGNVGRFINQSCDPNLFVQNVFTDTHDPGYPVICFFTNRALEAGTELTWKYSPPDTGSAPSESDQEVACQCGSDGCRGKLLLSQQEAV